MSRLILTLFFLNFPFKMTNAQTNSAEILITGLEKKLELKLVDYSASIVTWLEAINDGYYKNSELGKLIRYEEIKPKLDVIDVGSRSDYFTEARASKKLSMAMLPIIFHIGATTTWLVVTTILSAKSVAIGLILLIFKIAVSSAKISSFFTAWKVKSHHEDMSWHPHHEHHGHNDLYHLQRPAWNDYKSIPFGHELAYGESKNVENKLNY